MSEEKKEFVVKDRRIFSQDSREEASKEAAAQAEASPADETRAASSDGQNRETGKQATSKTVEPDDMPPLPEINFATFVVSLNASALLHLGAIEDPTTGKTSKDLPMAKQTIDILSILAKKTTNNLSSDEEKLLKNILYDLRIIFVKESG